MKPRLKAPGTKCWKVKYDNLLSNFAFTFNLRRYVMAALSAPGAMHLLAGLSTDQIEALLKSGVRPLNPKP
jgi:hypothetical protein